MFKLDILGELASIGARLKHANADISAVKAALITETATGATVTFTDGADGMPMKSLTVAINAVQSGSGDPSPDNIRPISGWTGANVTVNDSTIAVDFGRTVYGGTFDVVSGVLTVTHGMVDLGDITWTKETGVYDGLFRFTLNEMLYRSVPICSFYKGVYSATAGAIAENTIASTNSQALNYIRVRPSSTVYNTYDADDFKTYVNGQKFVYQLATPLSYQLTAQEVKTLLRSNTITADTGDSTVTYYADTKTYIDNAIAAAISALS